MKVFVSWSGARSQVLAHALREWLPMVLHYVQPWLSESDVAAGDRWASVLASELDASNFGIICVTPENAASPWLLFEAGALAKSMQDSRVIPLLFNLEFSDIGGPLAQFQAKKVDKTGLGEVIHSINRGPEEMITEEKAGQMFNALWPDFEKRLESMPTEAPSEKHMRPQHEIIEELVTGVRGLDSRFSDLQNSVSRPETRPRRRSRLIHPMMIDELALSFTEEPDDPLGILLLAGLFREDLPWISELLIETYREVRTGDEKTTRRAIERLHGVVRNFGRGPLEEMFMTDSRDGHMLMMELPRVLDHMLNRLGTTRDNRVLEPRDDSPDLPE